MNIKETTQERTFVIELTESELEEIHVALVDQANRRSLTERQKGTTPMLQAIYDARYAKV